MVYSDVAPNNNGHNESLASEDVNSMNGSPIPLMHLSAMYLLNSYNYLQKCESTFAGNPKCRNISKYCTCIQRMYYQVSTSRDWEQCNIYIYIYTGEY